MFFSLKCQKETDTVYWSSSYKATLAEIYSSELEQRLAVEHHVLLYKAARDAQKVNVTPTTPTATDPPIRLFSVSGMSFIVSFE